MKLLNKDFSYNYSSFSANGKIYRLVGTKCEEYEKPNLCEDCFVDEDGKFLTIVRQIIMDRQKEKKITPVIHSLIAIKSHDKKEWGKIILKDSFKNESNEK